MASHFERFVRFLLKKESKSVQLAHVRNTRFLAGVSACGGFVASVVMYLLGDDVGRVIKIFVFSLACMFVSVVTSAYLDFMDIEVKRADDDEKE